MVENLNIAPENSTLEERYNLLLPQIRSLVEGERDLIANMANIAAVLQMTFRHLWIGFYIVKGDELVLGPFQGPLACTRISFGNGVCGKAWEKQSSIIVKDVNSFPGHIACSADSKSEIVIPGIFKKKVIFVLDIDSDQIDTFNDRDRIYLEKIVELLINSSDC